MNNVLKITMTLCLSVFHTHLVLRAVLTQKWYRITGIGLVDTLLAANRITQLVRKSVVSN